MASRAKGAGGRWEAPGNALRLQQQVPPPFSICPGGVPRNLIFWGCKQGGPFQAGVAWRLGTQIGLFIWGQVRLIFLSRWPAIPRAEAGGCEASRFLYAFESVHSLVRHRRTIYPAPLAMFIWNLGLPNFAFKGTGRIVKPWQLATSSDGHVLALLCALHLTRI